MSALAHGGSSDYPSRVARTSPTSHHVMLPGAWLSRGSELVEDERIPFGIGVESHPQAMVAAICAGDVPDEDLLPWERALRDKDRLAA